MTESISAMVDGEIDEEIHSELLEELCRDPALKQRWQRYHLIRSAIRGECDSTLVRSEYADRSERARPGEQQTVKPLRTRVKFSGFFGRLLAGRLNWAGGLGLAAGLSAVAAVGFISGSFVDFQLLQQESGINSVAYSVAEPARWATSSEYEDLGLRGVSHLNESLLAHSESAGYSLMNGVSNYARLVSYNH